MNSSKVHFKYFVDPGLYVSRLEAFAKAQGILHGVDDDVRAAISENSRNAASVHAWHKLDVEALKQNAQLKPLNEVDTPKAKKVVKEMAAHEFECALVTTMSALVLTVGDKSGAPHVDDVAGVLRDVEIVYKALKASGIVKGWLSLPVPNKDPELRWTNVSISIFEELHGELLGRAPLGFEPNSSARLTNITVKNDLVCLATRKPSSWLKKSSRRNYNHIDEVQRVALPLSPPTGQEIECQICRTKFFFSDGEKAIFNKRGFAPPKRCKSCKKQQSVVRKATVPSMWRQHD